MLFLIFFTLFYFSFVKKLALVDELLACWLLFLCLLLCLFHLLFLSEILLLLSEILLFLDSDRTYCRP